ncbi:hypothetical protein [Roseibium polysiphoniae]|uniref:hypothetical protein n=1 Tax=Roseibium polysiphoniae TaxID=2571221 RepID=UPI00329A157F
MTRDQKFALFFGSVGITLAAAALIPAYFPESFNTQTEDAIVRTKCLELKTQFEIVSGDVRAQTKITKKSRRHLKNVESDIRYFTRRKELIEGFFVEKAVREEMRSYATAMLEVADEFEDEFAPFVCNLQRCNTPDPIIERFREALILGGLPSRPDTRQSKRLVFMNHGYDPSDYRIFDALPFTPETAQSVATELITAASKLGPNSDYLWRDSSWSNTFETIEGPRELENSKTELDRLADVLLQAKNDVTEAENEEDRLKRLSETLNAEIKRLSCDENNA